VFIINKADFDCLCRLAHPYSLLELSEQQSLKMRMKARGSVGNQLNGQTSLNKWISSLKKSDDPNRKQFEKLPSSGDPDRVLWAHITPKLGKSKIGTRKICTSPVVVKRSIGIKIDNGRI